MLGLVTSLNRHYRRFLPGAHKPKVCDNFKNVVLVAAGSTRLVSLLWEQTRPNTKHAAQQHTATPIRKSWAETNAAASAPSGRDQHVQLCRAALAHARSQPPGWQLGPPPPPPSARPPGLLPEAGRGVHLDVAAGRRASFPLLSVRHAAALYFLHWLRYATASRHLRSNDAAIRCCLRRPWEKWKLSKTPNNSRSVDNYAGFGLNKICRLTNH